MFINFCSFINYNNNEPLNSNNWQVQCLNWTQFLIVRRRRCYLYNLRFSSQFLAVVGNIKFTLWIIFITHYVYFNHVILYCVFFYIIGIISRLASVRRRSQWHNPVLTHNRCCDAIIAMSDGLLTPR